MSKHMIAALIALFVFGLVLIVYGQSTVGYGYLALEIIGLCAILFVVYCYNRQYK